MVLNYTSGTTSSPKGVVHCHRGLFLAALNALLDWSVSNQPVFLWTLPMFHSNGWSFSWGMAAVGGTNVCLRRFGVSRMCGAPVVLNMLSNSPTNQPLRNPVHILTVGAPPPASILLRAEALGFVVSHRHGLTKTCCAVLSCAWKPQWNRFPASERARLKARQGVEEVLAARERQHRRHLCSLPGRS
jgi:acyl-CoA synthetase (AMP-forming)/AMP-acid ligase II